MRIKISRTRDFTSSKFVEVNDLDEFMKYIKKELEDNDVYSFNIIEDPNEDYDNKYNLEVDIEYYDYND